MKIFRLPVERENLSLLFDMDGTLYTHDEYMSAQIDLPVKRLAQIKGKTFEQTKSEIDEYRNNWAAINGKTISLGNTFIHFGISITENIRWREELITPENFLSVDKQLVSTLTVLASRFNLAVVTNNPVSIAIRTLRALGVGDIINNIVGLDTCGLSKPDKVIFLQAVKLCKTDVQSCISIGDRYDIDIALPLELGMGGILVNGVQDVYELPDVLT